VVVRVQKAAQSTRLSMVHLNERKFFAIMTIDLCSGFLKDQFSFIVTGNEGAAIILQVVVAPSNFLLA
jgi:hypothetical protein